MAREVPDISDVHRPCVKFPAADQSARRARASCGLASQWGTPRGLRRRRSRRLNDQTLQRGVCALDSVQTPRLIHLESGALSCSAIQCVCSPIAWRRGTGCALRVGLSLFQASDDLLLGQSLVCARARPARRSARSAARSASAVSALYEATSSSPPPPRYAATRLPGARLRSTSWMTSLLLIAASVLSSSQRSRCIGP